MKFILAVTLSLLCLSCKKLVDVNPPNTGVTGEVVFNSDATATAILTGLYAKISNTGYPFGFDISTTSLTLGLSSDEFSLWSGVSNPNLSAYYTNKLSSTPSFEAGSEYWSVLYANIYTCNAAIEGLTNSRILTAAVKQQLLGEARFMRGLFYFYLVNLYGDLPLVISADYKVNLKLTRSPQTEIYKQILLDLKEAKNLLSENYVDVTLLHETTERVRPNKWAATALLSRVYLYTEDWNNADIQSSEVINNTELYDLDILADVFLQNSKEAIWQLQPVLAGKITNDGQLFVIPDTGPDEHNPVALSAGLLQAFETNDKRRSIWVDSINVDDEFLFYPYKYKENLPDLDVIEYLMIQRLGEVYLIRAEARAHLNNITGSQDDLNKIRNRAGLENTPANDQTALLTAIWHERRIELFSESGHRWLDLKRTQQVDAVMSTATVEKGGIWNANGQLYPIPYGDIKRAEGLIQNPGYN
jgi:hypothetical protein